MRKCPVCGEILEERDYIYKDKEGNLVGCEYCVNSIYAFEELPRYDEEQAREDYIDNRLWEQAKDERWGL